MAEFSGIKAGGKTYEMWATKSDVAIIDEDMRNMERVNMVVVPASATTLNAYPNTLYMCEGRTSSVDLAITLKPLVDDNISDYHQEYHFIFYSSEESTITFVYEGAGLSGDDTIPSTIHWPFDIAPSFNGIVEVGILNGLAVYTTY